MPPKPGDNMDTSYVQETLPGAFMDLERLADEDRAKSRSGPDHY